MLGIHIRPGPPGAVSPPVSTAPQILIAWGQSNMRDSSNDDDTSIAWPEDVLVLDVETEAFDPPVSPLKTLQNNPGSGSFGSGPFQLVKHFLIDYRAAGFTNPVIVVPVAVAGTGFINDDNGRGTWDPQDGTLYDEMLRLLDIADAAYPAAEYLAMLAHQGERDGNDGNLTHVFMAHEMVAKLRARSGALQMPLIWGEIGPVPQFEDNATPAHDAIRAGIRSMPERIAYAATMRDTDPAAFDALTDRDGVHFDGPSQRALGSLAYGALSRARANPAPLPDTALVWATTGERVYTNGTNTLPFDMAVPDMRVGDSFIVLHQGSRGAGVLNISGGSINGQPLISEISELTPQGILLAQDVLWLTLSEVPADGIYSVALDFPDRPSRRAISVLRMRGAPEWGVNAHVVNLANAGVVSGDIPTVPGAPVFMNAYANDPDDAISFTGSGAAQFGGACNQSEGYFSLRSLTASGSSETLTVTPSPTPRACGLLAVSVS